MLQRINILTRTQDKNFLPNIHNHETGQGSHIEKQKVLGKNGENIYSFIFPLNIIFTILFSTNPHGLVIDDLRTSC